MKRHIIIISAACVATLLLACGDETITDPAPNIEPTSPARVLENVERAFNQRDIGLLKAMLSEGFVFHFDPRDVGTYPPGGNYIIPESWSYTEFTQAISNMFTKVYSIDMTIPTGGVGEPAPGETTYEAENISITLTVMVDETNGYRIDRGYCNFAFERYVTARGKNYWRLTKWWDHTSAGFDGPRTLRPATLGSIFAAYR